MYAANRLRHVVFVMFVYFSTVVSAQALEHEFHGMFRVRGFLSNSDNGSGGFLSVEKDAPTKRYTEQRARIAYLAKVNADLKLVAQVEIDSRWGDNSYNSNNTTGNNGGALGADQVNIETKNLYIDYNRPSTPLNVKIGMQTFIDAYGGMLVNADMAGLLASTKHGAFNGTIGYFSFEDKGAVLGKQARDFIVVDGKYVLNADTKLGASYYLLNDDTNFRSTENPGDATTGTFSSLYDPFRVSSNSIVHSFGVNGETKLGPATVNAGFLYQFGTLEKLFTYTPAQAAKGTFTNTGSGHLSAFAATVGVKSKVGIGTAKATFLYTSGEGTPTSGNSNAFQSIQNLNGRGFSENTFQVTDMMIMMRTKYSLNTDRVLVYTTNNKNQGIISGFVGYDAPLTSEVFAAGNAGFMAVAKDTVGVKPVNKNTNTINNSQYIGTEINAEIGYKYNENLTASVMGAYVLLGDYYKGTATGGADPDNPYSARVQVSYTF